MAKPSNPFQTIRTEGAILPPDILRRIAALTVEGATPDAYHLSPGTKLNEAISQSWATLLRHWHAFQAARVALPEHDTTATTVTNNRWLLPLFNELGYGRLVTRKAPEIDGRIYPIERFYHHTPIHLVGCKLPLDRRTSGARGAATASPHAMMQELLNRSDDHLWAVLSNGLQLRVLRDNVSLSRQAFVEFDLESMMDGEVYADFSLLWLLCHQSRVESDQAVQCWLEQWCALASEQGTRVLDDLRVGVQDAIEALGRGVLGHPRNDRLRDKLSSGTLSTDEFYRQLLRVVYRLLFLFVAEDRELLHPTNASADACELYDTHYSTRRLRDLARKMRGSKHADLWYALSLVFEALSKTEGCPELGLCGLGSFLWQSASTADLRGPGQQPGGGAPADGASDPVLITNTDLLQTIRALAYVEQDRVLRSVDYRNLGSEELGSVYESLLELHPVVHADANAFALVTAAGNERKTTGSYYTPDALVQCLLDSALDPVVADRLQHTHGKDAEQALLDLKVCDPACGSGHFLLAAAHRLARHLARVQTGEAEPSPADYQHALRDVIGRCIYGVDLNPMAVELCKVSLWMEAMEPGKPLSFLDHHIQCGNSLLGTTPALMARGIPNDALKPIEGDDREVAKWLIKRNRDERKGQPTFLGQLTAEPGADYEAVATQAAGVETAADDSITAVREKARRWEQLAGSAVFTEAWFRADAWCAAFVWPKQPGDLGDAAITHDTWRRIEQDVSAAGPVTTTTVRALAQQYRFFHWHLAFPQVFGEPKRQWVEDDTLGCPGGFDAVVGNPPWEAEELIEKEFFSVSAPDIAQVRTKARRVVLIAQLERSEPALYRQWLATRRAYSARTHFGRVAGFQPLGGRGKINTYRLFAELAAILAGDRGRVGLILKSGIINAQDSVPLFGSWVRTNRVVSVFDFINRKLLFPEVVANERFCVLSLRQPGKGALMTRYVFGLEDPSELVHCNFLEMSGADIAEINPNDFSVPPVGSPRSLELLLKIHRRHGTLRDSGGTHNPWCVHYTQGHLNSASGSKLFKDLTVEFFKAAGVDLGSMASVSDEGSIVGDYLPLYEGKFMAQMNHRFGTFQGVLEERRFGVKAEPRRPTAEQLDDPWYEIEPRYWLRRKDAEEIFAQKRTSQPWLFAFRDVCRAIVDARTVQACVLPLFPCVDGAPLLVFSTEESMAARSALLMNATWASFVFDFAARQKIPGAHLTKAIMYQLPMPSPSAFEGRFLAGSFGGFVLPRAVECSYVTWSLRRVASAAGYDGSPFHWDENRRFLLRCELDAAFFHLYGIERDDVDYIMDTFPIVRSRDEAAHGDYRTKLKILDIYDAMQRAIDTGEPYQTLLDPPPADPRVAHPKSTRPDLAASER